MRAIRPSQLEERQTVISFFQQGRLLAIAIELQATGRSASSLSRAALIQCSNHPYVFWLGFISIFGLVLLSFGFRLPKSSVVALAFGAGLLHMAAMFFYNAALKAGEASQTLAIMGGSAPWPQP